MSFIDWVTDDTRRAWEATLWSNTIRILFVIDGRVVLTEGNGFGLGFVLHTLRAPFSWWVTFEVDIAKRDGELLPEDLGSNQLAYRNFKFTDAGFDLDAYDQVWFFGDLPNAHDGADGATTDEDIPAGFALVDAELKLLADWMARGGGVFATGDHNILGASMCSRIPRVRTMRKWTFQQRVPSKGGSAQHQTLQPPDHAEGDTVLQPIELVYRRVGSPVSFPSKPVPHPILVSMTGPIEQFPDHMHEGEVIADDDVELDRPLGIPGHDRPEYPFVMPVALPSAALEVSTLKRRPVPRVIAFGETTNRPKPEATTFFAAAPPFTFPGPDLLRTRFGLVSTYDGDAVELGRVVVDSTWHHWFSMNLLGIEAGDTPAYQDMQAYYRNVGLWLAKPSQRQSMLVSGIWGVLVLSAPIEFNRGDEPWQMGERVSALLARTTSREMLGSFAAAFLPRLERTTGDKGDAPQALQAWTGVSDDLMTLAIVSGISTSLVDLAFEARVIRSRGQRPRVDAEVLRERAVRGVSYGRALLKEVVDDAASALSTVRDSLEGNVEKSFGDGHASAARSASLTGETPHTS